MGSYSPSGRAGRIAAAQLTGRWLATLLFGVSASDLTSYALALLLIPAAVSLACWRPARGAGVTKPAEIIRQSKPQSGSAYSCFSAAAGSMRVARRAGSQQATTATASRAAPTAIKVVGSCGGTP
jgi:hypothetical protein